MNLKYQGVNSRGRREWLDTDLNQVMEEWQKEHYETYVTELEKMLNRKLCKTELQHILWLSGFDESTIDTFRGLFRDLKEVL